MFRRRPRPRPPGGLRAALLAADATEAGFPPDGSRKVWGVLVDLPRPGGADTLVVLTDGKAILASGVGGELASAREPVAVAAHALVFEVERMLDHFEPTTDRRLPSPHAVRFWALTYRGVQMAEASRLDLERRDHPIARAHHDALAVVDELCYGGGPRETVPSTVMVMPGL